MTDFKSLLENAEYMEDLEVPHNPTTSTIPEASSQTTDRSSPLSSLPSSQSILEEAEYMEDLPHNAATSNSQSSETTKTVSKTAVSSTNVTSASVKTKKAPATSTSNETTGKKRQLNLLDMMASSSSKTYKRQRTTSTSSVSSDGTTKGVDAGPTRPPRLVDGLRPFNTIPFNMEAFKEDLKEEEARLLNLECETMGRTWVRFLLNFSASCSRIALRGTSVETLN